MSLLPYWIALGAIAGFVLAWRSGHDAFPMIVRILWPMDDIQIERHPLLHRLGFCTLIAAGGAIIAAAVWAAWRVAVGAW